MLSMRSDILLICSAVLSMAFRSGTKDILNSARQLYPLAVKSQAQAEKLKTLTSGKTTPLLKAYNGSAFALLAKHHFSPYKKLELLNKGLSLINEAAQADGEDVEIRFLRFALEENIPVYVPFTSHIAEDKKILVDKLSSSHPHYKFMLDYLKRSGKLSKEEKIKLGAISRQ